MGGGGNKTIPGGHIRSINGKSARTDEIMSLPHCESLKITWKLKRWWQYWKITIFSFKFLFNAIISKPEVLPSLIKDRALRCGGEAAMRHQPPNLVAALKDQLFWRVYLAVDLNYRLLMLFFYFLLFDKVVKGWIRCTSWFNAGSRIIGNNLSGCFSSF